MNQTLTFSEAELAMLGKTADALSAYMGAAVLAEVGQTDEGDWVIFGRALGDGTSPEADTLHVQLGGPGAQILGEKGGLDTGTDTYDCAFLWAIQVTGDPEERFIRLDKEGEVFDAANHLSALLPFNLDEPEVPNDDETNATDND